MGDVRIEKDSFGPIEVPAARLWGAQTQRSLEHFRISGERMPAEVIQALAWVQDVTALDHDLIRHIVRTLLVIRLSASRPFRVRARVNTRRSDQAIAHDDQPLTPAVSWRAREVTSRGVCRPG